MTKFLILHGTDASPQANWYTWLKGKLIGSGHTVWLPQLPNSNKPNTKTYNDFILADKNFVIDAETVIIGHSSGAVEALSLLQNIPGDTVIKAAILVSVFKDDLEWDSLSELFAEPFDFDAITSHCKKFVVVHSDDDPYIPTEQAEFITEKLGGKLIMMFGQGHFSMESDPEYKKFPELFEIIESNI